MAQESVKLPTAYVKKVRKNKKATGVPIAVFICQAIDEKISGGNELVESLKEVLDELNKAEHTNSFQKLLPLIMKIQDQLKRYHA